jgi:hypothetical protein
MYAGDPGYFEYDDKYAPLCVKTARPTGHVPDIVPILQSYYNDTYSYGQKHAWAIQPSGISAAEAAFLLMKGRMTKTPTPYRKKPQRNMVCITEQEVLHCSIEVVKLYKQMLQIDDNHASILQHVLQLPSYYCNDIVPRITQQVKQFLKQYQLTARQYTKVLKVAQPQLSRIIARYYQERKAKG